MPTPNNQFRLKLQPDTAYDFSVDWGDGSKEIYRGTTPSIASDAGVSHTYTTAGLQIVSITENTVGGFPKPFYDGFRNTDANNDDIKVKTIKQWGKGRYSDLAFSFAGCINMNVETLDSDTSNINLVTNLEGAFYNCVTINNFPTINTSNVTNFNSTWYNCTNLSDIFPLLNLNKMNNGFNCFFNVKLSIATYDQLLQNLANNNLNTDVVFHAGQNTFYSPAAKPFRDILTNARRWQITDGGMGNSLTLRKTGLTQGQRDVFDYMTNPSGIQCGVGCNETSENFAANQTVVLNYTESSNPSCPTPNVFYITSRAVRYDYEAGSGISMVGNGILNTGELMTVDNSLVLEGTPSDGTPYDYGDGIYIKYREITIVMSNNIIVTAQIRCS